MPMVPANGRDVMHTKKNEKENCCRSVDLNGELSAPLEVDDNGGVL